MNLRCQNWQVSNERQKLQKTIVTNELSAFDFWRIQSFIKIEAFTVLRLKPWLKRWQMPTLTGVKNHRKLLSSMNSAPPNCSLCKISWKMVNLIPRSPFLIPCSPFPFLKVAFKDKKNVSRFRDLSARFRFFEKDLGIVSPSYFVYDFSRKIVLML